MQVSKNDLVQVDQLQSNRFIAWIFHGGRDMSQNLGSDVAAGLIEKNMSDNLSRPIVAVKIASSQNTLEWFP